jgi:fructokinase
MPVFGGIEAGGTKFVCGAGSGPEDLETLEFPTLAPEETISRAARFFRERPVEVIGIGSFGPIDPNPRSATFGFITTTPKRNWRNFDMAGAVRSAMGVRVAFDTDVNAAALGEHRWGAARGLSDFLYLTVGTGIGGGGMANGRLLHGRMHPEMGHVRVPHDWKRDPFPGCCPFHGDCLEGLAAGPAIERRWGAQGESLPAGHAAWELESDYLALGLVSWICTLSPQRIILGGGIAERLDLLGLQRKVGTLLNGYLDPPDMVAPGLGSLAGVLGALALAEALQCENSGGPVDDNGAASV